MTIPHRGWASHSTYFVSASYWEKQRLLQSVRMAELFIDVLDHYRRQQKYLLHEFVIMPNHFHLLITPAETLERTLQLIKGGFSFRAKKELKVSGKLASTITVCGTTANTRTRKSTFTRTQSERDWSSGQKIIRTAPQIPDSSWMKYLSG